MGLSTSIFLRAVVISATASVSAAPSTPPLAREEMKRVSAFVHAWCIECHQGSDAEGELDLNALLTRWNEVGHAASTPGREGEAETEGHASDLQRWIEALQRVDSGKMPPRKAPQPPAAEVEALSTALREALRQALDSVESKQPGGAAGAARGFDFIEKREQPIVRRLTRGEYRRSVRDLFGVDIDFGSLLPVEDPGNGFDTASDGLSLSPLAVERFIEAAERVASAVAPDEASWNGRWFFEGTQLQRAGSGSMSDGAQMLWSAGRISANWHAPADGRYRVRVRSWGQQAGEEPVRLSLRVEPRRTIATFDVPNERDDPLTTEHTSELVAGATRVDVVFLNDFWKPDHPDPRRRDRNAAVVSIEIEGPLGPPPTPKTLVLPPGAELDASHVAEFVRATATRAFRRPVEDHEVRSLLDIAGEGASPRTQLNGAIAGMLAAPSFLLRTDAALPSGYGAAARLAGFLWSSVPDDALLQAAAEGRLDSPAERALEARRMLDDPRSRALAEEFATQWLSIRELDRRVPDPSRFPGVDAALLASMREETIRWFDAMVRERRPVREVITCEWSVMDERLMRHGGVGRDEVLSAPDADGWRRVRVERGGVLRQPSILLATSNPTRTSPVKRGRFVLAALLDEEPPPPPPGVPQLPADAGDHGASIAEMMERHRSDPACAACHRSMDSIGLLLERYDAVGRVRNAPAIEAELPDGRIVHSSEQLMSALVADAALARTLARRLLVYATGRSLSPSAREASDHLADELGASGTLHELIVRLVELGAFLPDAGGPRS